MPRASSVESSFVAVCKRSLVVRRAIGNAVETSIKNEKKMIHWGSSKTSKYTQASGAFPFGRPAMRVWRQLHKNRSSGKTDSQKEKWSLGSHILLKRVSENPFSGKTFFIQFIPGVVDRQEWLHRLCHVIRQILLVRLHYTHL